MNNLCGIDGTTFKDIMLLISILCIDYFLYVDYIVWISVTGEVSL